MFGQKLFIFNFLVHPLIDWTSIRQHFSNWPSFQQRGILPMYVVACQRWWWRWKAFNTYPSVFCVPAATIWTRVAVTQIEWSSRKRRLVVHHHRITNYQLRDTSSRIPILDPSHVTRLAAEPHNDDHRRARRTCIWLSTDQVIIVSDHHHCSARATYCVRLVFDEDSSTWTSQRWIATFNAQTWLKDFGSSFERKKVVWLNL